MVRLIRRSHLVGAVIVVALAFSGAPRADAVARPEVLRVGGPSAPGDTKIALLSSSVNRAGQPFDVIDATGNKVLTGTLAKGVNPAPWKFAATADLSAISIPGAYQVRAGGLVSRPWEVRAGAGREPIPTLLQFFAANRDGAEPSPLHAPAHLHDAKVVGGPHDAQTIDLTGGWMDAGDMLHFTETTAYATTVLQLAADLDPTDTTALRAEADIGVRWLVRAHPAPDLFIGQVGDERDHNLGFRDPALDDGRSEPGIGTRFAYPSTGSSLAGKSAAALALAAERTTPGPVRDTLLARARDWYAAGKATAGVGPLLRGGFYRASSWQDDLALGAVMLYRVTGDAADLTEAVGYLQAITQDTLGWDDVAALAGADLCGAFAHPAVTDAAARNLGCTRLQQVALAAFATAAGNPWATPGYYTWGQTAVNGGNGAAIALDARVGQAPTASGAQRARDYLLGLNQWGSSFVVGLGPSSPQPPPHWASISGDALPVGAVVGGPAPKSEIRAQGFRVNDAFSNGKAAYADNVDNYVTSEPALDYTANSILLLAAL